MACQHLAQPTSMDPAHTLGHSGPGRPARLVSSGRQTARTRVHSIQRCGAATAETAGLAHEGPGPASRPQASAIFLGMEMSTQLLPIKQASRLSNPDRQIKQTTGDCGVHSTSYDKGSIVFHVRSRARPALYPFLYSSPPGPAVVPFSGWWSGRPCIVEFSAVRL